MQWAKPEAKKAQRAVGQPSSTLVHGETWMECFVGAEEEFVVSPKSVAWHLLAGQPRVGCPASHFTLSASTLATTPPYSYK
jgi:hypothetical protein